MKIYSSQMPHARCTASLGSVTVAMRARRMLGAHGIKCDVIKISSDSSSRGCVYGIEYPCELSGSVRSLLSSVGMQTR
ncbi:MAG: DUF3343 domain-containing protein [Ruminococcaceae bacterium]|nr:DUF3343 domain-containing protein [Oscillospiraceae bacterium]